MNVVDTIFEETISDRRWIVERVKKKVAGYDEIIDIRVKGKREYKRRLSNRQLTKYIKKDALSNLQVVLNSYVKLLDEKLYKYHKEKIIENEERLKVRYSNIEHLSFKSDEKIRLKEFKGSEELIWIIPFSILSIFIPYVGGTLCIAGFVAYCFLDKSEKKNIKKEMKLYIEDLDRELERFTFEYCKGYEKNLNRAIEYCNEVSIEGNN